MPMLGVVVVLLLILQMIPISGERAVSDDQWHPGERRGLGGWTAIERAELYGHADVVTALEGAGATR